MFRIRGPLWIGVLEYPYVCSDDHMTICHMPICPYGPDRMIICPFDRMIWTIWSYNHLGDPLIPRKSPSGILDTYLSYHTIPYHNRLCLPYHHTNHKNHTHGIGLANCINSCMCSSFRIAPAHDAYVLHAISTSGFCICQKNARFDHWATRVSGALVRFYYLAVEVPKLFPKVPNQLPTLLK